MQDFRASQRGSFAGIGGWLKTVQRLISHQNELWLRALREGSDGRYNPTQWIADIKDLAQQWQVAFRDHVASSEPNAGATTNLPNVFFEVDEHAECADAKPLYLPRALTPSVVGATSLQSIDGTSSAPDARVTVRHFSGDSHVFVGLAGLRNLAAGRYISLIEDGTGRAVGAVFVKRA
jgi:hypothetical protein